MKEVRILVVALKFFILTTCDKDEYAVTCYVYYATLIVDTFTVLKLLTWE